VKYLLWNWQVLVKVIGGFFKDFSNKFLKNFGTNVSCSSLDWNSVRMNPKQTRAFLLSLYQ
jgi:hypothetical protein